jgi:hypothetical protein
MITTLAAVLLCSLASAGVQAPAPPAMPAAPPAPSAPPSPAAAPRARPVHAAPAAAPAPAETPALSLSTYTVSTLYTGDQVRDPFMAPSMGGGPARPRSRNAPVDIHSLELRGIMKDERSDFALFTADNGTTLILRGARLYDGHGRRVPGITGFIQMKKKRAELVTSDKDVQVYILGQAEEKKADDGGTDETEDTGSGRSP